MDLKKTCTPSMRCWLIAYYIAFRVIRLWIGINKITRVYTVHALDLVQYIHRCVCILGCIVIERRLLSY